MQRFQIKPTYFFGKNAISALDEIFKKQTYKSIMLVYGFSSIKKSGLYDQILEYLKKYNLRFCEYSGIKANPRDWQCDEAAELVIKNNVDLIIAAGGGSTIDAAKVISAYSQNHELFSKSWDYVIGGQVSVDKLTKSPVDVVSILTTAATGSENNAGSVITNETTKMKIAIHGPLGVVPKYVIEDPTYTFSLNHWQTACGIFDIFTHLIEQYYALTESFDWTEEYLIANLKVLLKHAKTVLEEPTNYVARANIMWTSSWALNGLASFENYGESWDIHLMEHSLSALFDVSHGAGLALIAPTYIDYQSKKNKLFYEKTIKLGKQIFGTNTLEEFISALHEFINLLELPTRYHEFDEIKKISNGDITELAKNCESKNSNPDSLLVSFEEIREIYDLIQK